MKVEVSKAAVNEFSRIGGRGQLDSGSGKSVREAFEQAAKSEVDIVILGADEVRIRAQQVRMWREPERELGVGWEASGWRELEPGAGDLCGRAGRGQRTCR